MWETLGLVAFEHVFDRAFADQEGAQRAVGR